MTTEESRFKLPTLDLTSKIIVQSKCSWVSNRM